MHAMNCDSDPKKADPQLLLKAPNYLGLQAW